MRYNDSEYLTAFYENGEYPKIHNDIWAASEAFHGQNVLDLGSCIGLLSKRLSQRNLKVFGVEANKSSIARAVQGDNITYVNMKVEMQTLDAFGKLITDNDIVTIYARRVIPELYETGGMELVRGFGQTCFDAGIKNIILEGRKKVPHPKNILYDSDQECEALAQWFDVIGAYREVRILKSRRDE